MTVFRSSLFTVRVGDQSVGIGPSSFLQIVLGAADRAVDRTRATARAQIVAKIMKGVSFKKGAWALSTFALALMQNAPEEYQQGLRTQIEALTSKSDITDYSKALSLGLLIMNMMGEGVLLASVNTLRDQIGVDQIPTTEA